jgi:hypothetical protein
VLTSARCPGGATEQPSNRSRVGGRPPKAYGNVQNFLRFFRQVRGPDQC